VGVSGSVSVFYNIKKGRNAGTTELELEIECPRCNYILTTM